MFPAAFLTWPMLQLCSTRGPLRSQGRPAQLQRRRRGKWELGSSLIVALCCVADFLHGLLRQMRSLLKSLGSETGHS